MYQFAHGEEVQNSYLSSPRIDVDALARKYELSLTSTFVIRFQQIGSGNFNTSFDEDGFIIDDVSVIVPEIQYASLPFEDGFESGVLGPMWREVDPSDPSIGQVTAPDFAPHRFAGFANIVNRVDDAHTGSFSIWIGRAIDGNSTTSAMDLRLNLEGQNGAELRFFWADFFDETQQQEGLYFSDDGGQTFTQVLELDPSNATNRSYGEQVVDIAALADANDLILTSTFIIRFQQIGSGNF